MPHLRWREVAVPQYQMDVVASVSVAAFNEIHIVKGPVAPFLQPVKKAAPCPAHILKAGRLMLPVKGECVDAALIAKQGQAQLQPVHPGPAHGGIPGRTENFVLLRPLVGSVAGDEPRAYAPALLYQRACPLADAEPDCFVRHGACQLLSADLFKMDYP